MPIETVPLTGYRYQCDRCQTATPPERSTLLLAVINPDWGMADGVVLCPSCATTEQRHRRIPGKTLRETLGTIGASFDRAAFWRTADSIPAGNDLTAADVLRMRFDDAGQVRQSYADIAQALGVSASRARALVLKAAYRVRAELRKRGEQ